MKTLICKIFSKRAFEEPIRVSTRIIGVMLLMALVFSQLLPTGNSGVLQFVVTFPVLYMAAAGYSISFRKQMPKVMARKIANYHTAFLGVLTIFAIYFLGYKDIPINVFTIIVGGFGIVNWIVCYAGLRFLSKASARAV